MFMDGFEDSLMDVFIFETKTFLEGIETILLDIGTGSASMKNSIPELFRIMHTIKSSAAIMGFESISAIAHAAEDLLSYVRDSKTDHADEDKLSDLVFLCADFIKQNLADPGVSESDELVARIDGYLQQLKAGASNLSDIGIHVRFVPDCQMIGVRAFELETRLGAVAQNIEATPNDSESDYEKKLQSDGLTLTMQSVLAAEEICSIIQKNVLYVAEVSVRDIDALNNGGITRFAPPSLDPRVDRTENILPVAVNRLDEIIALSGELVIAEMRLSHARSSGDADKISEAINELTKLIAQMQKATLSIRMITLRNTFHKLKRLERDLSKKLGKEISLELSGEEIELDKSVVDGIMTPLSHILRNAIDHGIEPPDEREQLGKTRTGKIRISATSNARHVMISISDDGRGLDRKLLIHKAVEKGLIAAEEVEELSPEEIDNLVFLPGFSTAETVTEISGRGVGLDVVSDSVKGLLGGITLSNTPGQGTEFILRLPLTLSSMDALMLRSGDKSVLLSVGDVKEIFQPEDLEIAVINGHDSVLYQNSCYKIKTLAEFFGQEKPASYDSGIMILIKSEPEPYVLYLDEIIDHRSVVVKPVPALLAGMRGVAGCSVLGDGNICLIIDVRSFYGR